MLTGDLIAALMLLTRLPVARFALPHDAARVGRCIWAFPVVGLVVGAAGALTYSAVHKFLPPLLAATWTVAVMMLVTGALHEDELADTMDGFGGGKTRDDKLAIMRDSRIGSYGALAIVVCLAVRITAFGRLGEPGLVARGLVLAGMLARSFMLVPVLMLDPARDDGLASELGKREAWAAGLAFAIAVGACVLCMTFAQVMAVMAVATAACLGLVKLARSQIGGYTGDFLGACEIIVECVILTAIVGIERVND